MAFGGNCSHQGPEKYNGKKGGYSQMRAIMKRYVQVGQMASCQIGFMGVFDACIVCRSFFPVLSGFLQKPVSNFISWSVSFGWYLRVHLCR